MPEEVAQGTTNTKTGSKVTANVAASPLYFFRPETEEIYECLPADALAVRREISLLDRISTTLSMARAKTGELLDQVDRVALPDDRERLLRELRSAEKDEAAARDKLYQELKELRGSNKNGSELLELLPLHTPKAGQSGLLGKKFTYVRSSKVKSHFRSYQLSNADKPKMSSFLVNGKLDEKKLKESFSKVTIKGGLGQVGGQLWAKEFVPEFVKAFNELSSPPTDASGESQAPADKEQADFSSGATLLRFFSVADYSAGSNVTAKSLTEALKGRGEIKGAYKGRADVALHLATGEAKWNFYFPRKKGLELYLPVPVLEKKQETTHLTQLTLGHFRVLISANCKSLVGASLLCEGGIEFVLERAATGKEGRQSIVGKPIARDSQTMARPQLDITRIADAKNSLGAELTAFAGAQAEAQIKGAFEWQRPESSEFRPFAEIAPSITPQAGVGATAAFNIKYVNGKFRIFVQLGACAGIGAKGGLEATVGVAHIAEFALWFKHQVKCSMDKNLKYFESKAFSTFCTMYTLAMAEGKSIATYMGLSAWRMGNMLTELISNDPERVLRNINAAGTELTTAIAEVKGFLTAALNRIRSRAIKLDYQVETVARKILLSASTDEERKNIYRSVNFDFKPEPDGATGRALVATMIGGPDQLAAIESLHNSDPAPGYRLAFADTKAYAVASGLHVSWDESKLWLSQQSGLALQGA